MKIVEKVGDDDDDDNNSNRNNNKTHMIVESVFIEKTRILITCVKHIDDDDDGDDFAKKSPSTRLDYLAHSHTHTHRHVQQY